MKPIICVTAKEFILRAYDILYRTYGPQHWWPAKTRFEVMVGAILTQSTNWGNVEKAIANLRREKLLTINKLNELKLPELAQLIRPSGYFNQKAIKLKNLVNYIIERYNGSLSKMVSPPLDVLRPELLEVHGIGPETADCILLYALDKPIFVVDAYTKRILLQHRLIDARATYSMIQQLLMESLPLDVKLFNEYHALIVRVGKEHYRGQMESPNSPLHALIYKGK